MEQVYLVLQMVICPLPNLLNNSECHGLQTIPATRKKAKTEKFFTVLNNKLLRKGSNCWCPDYVVGFDKFCECYSTDLHFCFLEFLYTVHSNILNYLMKQM